MVTKVWESPEIFQIPVSLPDNPLRSVNVYVLRGGEKNLVIDTGFNRPECRQALRSGIDELGLDMEKTDLYITHFHADHCGLAWDFADRGCQVYMGRIDHEYLSYIKSGEYWPKVDALFLREGMPREVVRLQNTENQGRLFAVDRIFPAQTLEDGDKLNLGGLQAMCILTPGHTPGHMALYLPESKVLFSGDHILFDISPNISVYRGHPDTLADYLNSLELIGRLPVSGVFPAHRGAEGSLSARTESLLKHHRTRLEEVLSVLREMGASSGYEVARRLTWSARGKKFDDFSSHQKWFAMGEALSHLYHLANLGDVIRNEETEPILYKV